MTDNAHRSVQLDSTSSAEINNGKNEHIGIIVHFLGREIGGGGSPPGAGDGVAETPHLTCPEWAHIPNNHH